MSDSTYHTSGLMDRIHPGLRDKYSLMLNDWKREVRTWTAPAEVKQSKFDVTPSDKTGAWTLSEDQFLLAHYRHRKTKVIATVLQRSPEAVFARAQVMGLRKDEP